MHAVVYQGDLAFALFQDGVRDGCESCRGHAADVEVVALLFSPRVRKQDLGAAAASTFVRCSRLPVPGHAGDFQVRRCPAGPQQSHRQDGARWLHVQVVRRFAESSKRAAWMFHAAAVADAKTKGGPNMSRTTMRTAGADYRTS